MDADNSHMDSLGEQTKLINMAVKHTRGNVEKARLMAAGQFSNVAVVKAKFSNEDPGVHGALSVFVNTEDHYIMNILTLMLSDKAKIERLRIFDAWKNFYGDLNGLIRDAGALNKGGYEFSTHLADSMVGYDIYDDVENGDLDGATQIFTEIIGKFPGAGKVKCQIEIEKTSSLAMELEGIPTEAYSGGEAESETTPLSAEDERVRAIEEGAEHVIQGKIMVSPVRGKYINDVKPGENIKVLLTNHDEVSKKVAKVLNAYTEEGEFLPIKGRVKEKVSMGKSGYIMYALVAKNVLAKIIEEENVKIEMEAMGAGEKAENKDTRLILYVSLLLGLVLFTLILLFALF
ncbi:MAG TPA: hypothetical protein ENN21_00600 [Spirochaetes bacterium]|nr:hypothetical protein [Spirochaetota bacterium]